MADSPPTPTAPPSAAAHPRRSHRRQWIALLVTVGFGVLYLATHIATHIVLYREIEAAEQTGLFRSHDMLVRVQSYRPSVAGLPRHTLDDVHAMIREPDPALVPLLPLVGTAPMPLPGERMGAEQLGAIRSYLESNSEVLGANAMILSRNVGQFSSPVVSEPPHLIAARQLTRMHVLGAIYNMHHPDFSRRYGRTFDLYVAAAFSGNRDSRLIGFLSDRSNSSLMVSQFEYLINHPDADYSGVSSNHTILNALSDKDASVRHELSATLRTALCIELSLGHQTLNDSFGSPHAHAPGLSAHETLWLCNRFGLRNHTRHLGYLRAMNKLIDAAGAPHHERIARFQGAYDEIGAGPGVLYDYARQQIAAYPTALHLDMLVEARVRTARAAMLALIYYQNEGRLPATLDALSQVKRNDSGSGERSWLTGLLAGPQPTLPPLSPPDPDPYTGRPLIYKVLPSGGFMVYSVGEDGVDHGGVRKNEAGQDFGPGADVPFTILRLPSR